MTGGLNRLVLVEGRKDGVRAVMVPRDVAVLIEVWRKLGKDVDPVELLREEKGTGYFSPWWAHGALNASREK